MAGSLLIKRRADSALHPLVQELSRDLNNVGDGAALSNTAFVSWRARLAAIEEDERENIAAHMVALALRLQEMLPNGGDAAILQLARLTNALVADATQVAVLFAGLGVDADELVKVIERDR